VLVRAQIPEDTARAKNPPLEQFAIEDNRSPAELAQMLKTNGYETVWKDWDITYRSIYRYPAMTPQRAWIDSSQTLKCTLGLRLKLSESESTHIIRSLRYRSGDSIILINGKGLVINGKIELADSNSSVIEIVDSNQIPKPIA
jgi:hypothetical protein